jgi:hypothetical protein
MREWGKRSGAGRQSRVALAASQPHLAVGPVTIKGTAMRPRRPPFNVAPQRFAISIVIADAKRARRLQHRAL